MRFSKSIASTGYHRSKALEPIGSLADCFGLRSSRQLGSDLEEVLRATIDRSRFQVDLSSAGHLRPALSLPAYAGMVPDDGLAPIMNFFDRTGGGRRYTQRVTRRTARDFRGGRLTYDEHDGTDIVCPPGTPLCAAAPGTVVLIRDRWLRGGLTVSIDHGAGIVTHYTHCARVVCDVGDEVERGQVVAVSGASGIDMASSFPWVPPHIHFMVWDNGTPVDPFLGERELRAIGVWAARNAPTPGYRTPDETAPAGSIDEGAVTYLANTCTDPRIAAEIDALRDRPRSLAALLEDAVHHDAWAFPAYVDPRDLRPQAEREAANRIKLTLPLPASEYEGVRFADTLFTKPS